MMLYSKSRKGDAVIGKTSAEVKNRYNSKVYDRLNLVVKKGQREVIKSHAAAQGKSLNGYIVDLIEKDMAQPAPDESASGSAHLTPPNPPDK